MDSRSEPFGLVNNPLTISLYAQGSGQALIPESKEILTEAGLVLDAETGQALLIE